MFKNYLSIATRLPLALSVVSGCTSDQNKFVDLDPALVDIPWALVALRDDAGEIVPLVQEDGFEFSIRFTSEPFSATEAPFPGASLVRGVSVCNAFYGAYSLESNVISILDMSSTDVSCARSSEPASILFNRLVVSSASTVIYAVNANDMTLLSGSNEALYFSTE